VAQIQCGKLCQFCYHNATMHNKINKRMRDFTFTTLTGNLSQECCVSLPYFGCTVQFFMGCRNQQMSGLSCEQSVAKSSNLMGPKWQSYVIHIAPTNSTELSYHHEQLSTDDKNIRGDHSPDNVKIPDGSRHLAC